MTTEKPFAQEGYDLMAAAFEVHREQGGGHRLSVRYIPDLFVFESIVVELKAVTALATEHEAQLLNYMRITKQPVGYPINFGPVAKVEWKRFVLSEFVSGTSERG
jgi:hypothetical protein